MKLNVFYSFIGLIKLALTLSPKELEHFNANKKILKKK